MVTQTVEVNNQTEMINSLLDTYSNNNKFNNFQLIPNIDFPASNSADIDRHKKFFKPIWFIPTDDTDFSQGKPKDYPTRLSKVSVTQATRKSVCGLLKVAGFCEANESALICYQDAVDHFYKCFMEKIRETLTNTNQDTATEIDILTLDKAYSTMTGKNLTQLHNHIKNDIYVKNRQEVKQFKESMNEYDKLLQENNLKDYMNFLDPNAQTDSEFPSNFLEQEGDQRLKGILDGDLLANDPGPQSHEM